MSKIRFASEEYVNAKASDWNIPEGEPGYIKNRTHYSEEKLNVILENFTETSIGGGLGFVDFVDPLFPHSDANKEYVIILDGVKYRSTLTYDSMLAGPVLGNSEIYGPDAESRQENVPFFIHQWIEFESDTGTSYAIDFYYSDSNPHTISIYEVTGELEYHALDKNYLPMDDIYEEIMSRMAIAEEASF